jgi:hypothetical protein
LPIWGRAPPGHPPRPFINRPAAAAQPLGSAPPPPYWAPGPPCCPPPWSLPGCLPFRCRAPGRAPGLCVASSGLCAAVCCSCAAAGVQGSLPLVARVDSGQAGHGLGRGSLPPRPPPRPSSASARATASAASAANSCCPWGCLPSRHAQRSGGSTSACMRAPACKRTAGKQRALVHYRTPSNRCQVFFSSRVIGHNR